MVLAADSMRVLCVLVVCSVVTVVAHGSVPGAASSAHGLGGADSCVVYSSPDPAALAYPGDLGIHWEAMYDTQWWLGNFEDEATPGRHLGVELSVARITPTGVNCSRTQGVTFVFLGISDAKTQTYTQRSVMVNMTRDMWQITSTASPYNVTTAVQGVRAGVFAVPGASAGPNAQRIYATAGEGFPAAFKLDVETGAALENVKMADKGWLDMIVAYFTQVAQPELSGTAAITLASGEAITARGTVWLQHMWGTDPLSQRARHSRTPQPWPTPPVAMPGSGQVAWTWQSARLDSGLLISMTKFVTQGTTRAGVSDGGGPAVQYLDLVNRTTGEATMLSGSDFTVTLSDLWVSPASGNSYARRSDMVIPSLDLHLTWLTLVPDNEHYIADIIAYYEAACMINGTVAGTAVTGTGYLEHRLK